MMLGVLITVSQISVVIPDWHSSPLRISPRLKHSQVEQYRMYGISKLIITLDIGLLLTLGFGH
jgi:hypothetical protein